jgi:AraC-like DNA-binding protein/quercetin dioxygenase-like cupin family protein
MQIQSRLVFEKDEVDIPGFHAMGQYHYTAACPGLPPHRHRGCVEIQLLAKGYQAFQVGGKVYHVRGGEQYAILPDEVHDTAGQPEERGVVYWLILDVTRELDRFLYMDRKVARRLVHDLQHLPSRHFLSDPHNQTVLDKAFAVMRKIHRPNECTGLFRQSEPQRLDTGEHERFGREIEVVGHLLVYLLKTLQASRSHPRQPSPAIQCALSYIAENELSWLTVGEVAHASRLQVNQFRTQFRQDVGLSPADYMLRHKIEIAKRRLSEPKASVTEIAHTLGFSSSQYFATVFRRLTSLTPSEFIHGRRPPLIPIVERE